MAKFKVGDRVEMVRYVEVNTLDKPKIGTVHTITEDRGGSCFHEIKWWYRVGGFSNIAETEYELVEEECTPCGTTLINKKQTFMSKATTYIKNLTLSADEKLLRKYGFKDDCGDYTSEGVELVKAKLVKDNEDYLITIAKGLEEEAKENK